VASNDKETSEGNKETIEYSQETFTNRGEKPIRETKKISNGENRNE